MKQFITVTIALFLFSIANTLAQENKISKVEDFLGKSKSLIKREYIQVAIVQKMKIEVVTYTDMISGVNAKGIRFSYRNDESRFNPIIGRVLDEDEVDGFLKIIKIIREKVIPSNVNAHTEVYYNYMSRENISIGCSQEKENEWDVSLQLRDSEVFSVIPLDLKSLTELETALSMAKSQF